MFTILKNDTHFKNRKEELSIQCTSNPLFCE